MEEWEERGCPRLADWCACGHAIYFDPDICDPRLVLIDESDSGAWPPLAVLPAAATPATWEIMIGWCITELARARLGRCGFRERLVMYSHVAASVAVACWVLLDLDGDGMPDVLHQMLR